MPRTDTETLLLTLRAIRDHAEYRDDSEGLCSCVYMLAWHSPEAVFGSESNSRGTVDTVETMAKRLMREWPEHSGSRVYPVQGFEGLTPSEAYHSASERNEIWDKGTPYGRKRWALLHYVIECVEQEIGNQQSAIKESNHE